MQSVDQASLRKKLCNLVAQGDRLRGWALDQPIVQFRRIEEMK